MQAGALACTKSQAEPFATAPLHAGRCGPPLSPVRGGEWMIGKFATAPALTLLLSISLLGASSVAQTTPADQTPASMPTTPAVNAQQPSTPSAQQQGQEEAEVEGPLPRQRKPKDYKNWNYDVGAGASVYGGPTKTFARGGGVVGTVGVARNANKYLGLRADFMYQDLPLKQTSLLLAQAGSANTYVLAFTVDPIINFEVTKTVNAYVLFGPGYYHRGGTLNSDTAVPGTPCDAFFTWWNGTCNNVSLGLNGSFIHSSQNDFGYNVGAGVTRKMPSGVEVFAEFRLLHGSANGTTTDVRPITVGFRW